MAGGVELYRSQFSRDFCEDLIEILKKMNEYHTQNITETKTYIGTPKLTSERNNWFVNNTIFYFNTELFSNAVLLNKALGLELELEKTFDSVYAEYKKIWPYLKLHYKSKYRANYYPTDGYMGEHVDNATLKEDYTFQKVGHSQVTATAYLNDDFEGGDFHMLGEKVDVQVGDILLHPSNYQYPHEVKKITKGGRWSISKWLM